MSPQRKSYFGSPASTANIITPEVVDAYLKKHGWKGPLIADMPEDSLTLVVVIPAYDEPDLILVLEDLLKCEATKGCVEIIAIINCAENSTEELRQLSKSRFEDAANWAAENSVDNRRFYVLFHSDLPVRKAGVGLARKIGMDEAVRRFARNDNPMGVIVCLDADCRVQLNYLVEIEKFFALHTDIEACSLHFEHPLDELSPDQRESIIRYEMHLRYFIEMQRAVGYPFAYQTVGSSMAVRAETYCRVGGMNTRQAGEDFYFLHKVIERGAFADLNTTSVMPSARNSDRVPFGTGRAMINQLELGQEFLTYHPQSFFDISVFLRILPLCFGASPANLEFLLDHILPASVSTFLHENDILDVWTEIRKNTASEQAFIKRMLRWFNAFMLMKYVHFTRDHFYPAIPVEEATAAFFQCMGMSVTPEPKDMLLALRGHIRNSQ